MLSMCIFKALHNDEKFHFSSEDCTKIGHFKIKFKKNLGMGIIFFSNPTLVGGDTPPRTLLFRHGPPRAKLVP